MTHTCLMRTERAFPSRLAALRHASWSSAVDTKGRDRLAPPPSSRSRRTTWTPIDYPRAVARALDERPAPRLLSGSRFSEHPAHFTATTVRVGVYG